MENQSHDDISACNSGESNKGGHDFSYPSGPSVSDDDDVTESKIREFLDEKVLFPSVSANPIACVHCWFIIQQPKFLD